MKILISFISFFLFAVSTQAQVNQGDAATDTALYVITTHNGTEYVGTIISDDGREVLIDTKKLGKIYIKKADVRSMTKVEDPGAIVNGEYQATDPFTTRYAFTNNALPIKKGENYSMVSLIGPEVHFAVSNNLSLGMMSTWIASPLVLALKYSFKNKETKVNFSIGTLMGTTGYLTNFRGYGGLHWASLTLGDRKNNITFSGGYAYLQTGVMTNEPKPGIYYTTYPYISTTERLKPIIKGPMFSVAGIYKVGAKASLVFDSMAGIFSREGTTSDYRLLTPEYYDPNTGYFTPATYQLTVLRTENITTALFLMPGMRFQFSEDKAFQIALAGVSVFGNNTFSFPLPMVSWFNKF